MSPVSAVGSGQAFPLRQIAPDLIAIKVGEAGDSDGDGDIEPGDVLTYTIVITNVGNAVASNVTFSDTIDASTGRSWRASGDQPRRYLLD